MGASFLSSTYCGSATSSIHDALLVLSFGFYFMIFAFSFFYLFNPSPLLKVESARDEVSTGKSPETITSRALVAVRSCNK